VLSEVLGAELEEEQEGYWRSRRKRGVPIGCFQFKLHEIVVYQGFGTKFYVLLELDSGFWNFSRNRLAVARDSPGDTSYRPSFCVTSRQDLTDFK